MFDTGNTVFSSESGQISNWITVLLIAVLVWEVMWKGFGLWHAARNGQRNWFIAILVFNTIGILPIVYLKFYQKKQN